MQFNESAQSSLPRVSYSTRLDVFTGFAIGNLCVVFGFFTLFMLVESVISRSTTSQVWMRWWVRHRDHLNFGGLAISVVFFAISAPVVVLAS